MHLGDAERPVMNCEEFSYLGPGASGEPVGGAAAGADALEEEVETTGDLGLCTNCAARASCTLPRPDGGVWRCDAYR
jgi:hypothetical protein